MYGLVVVYVRPIIYNEFFMCVVTHVNGKKILCINVIRNSIHVIYFQMIINNIRSSIVNGSECHVSCLKYKIKLWRQFCNTVDLTSFE